MPSRESGTATLGITVADPLRRKTNTTSTTSTMDRSSVSWMSRNEARMVVVRSRTTARFTAGGIDALSSGISANTRSTVSITLAPGWRYTIIRTARLPLARPAVRTSSTEVSTVATSPSRTGAPLR